MSLNDLKGVLTCSYCQNFYEQPIMLPCQESICKKDLNNLYMKSSNEDIKFRTFKCPHCSCVHEEPLSGFPEDKKLKKILEVHGIGSTNNGNGSNSEKQKFSCESFNVARTCCTNLGEIYSEYTSLMENPYTHIDKYFAKVKQVIEDNREENRQIIERVYDDFLKDLKKLENECINHTKKNYNPDKNSTNYETLTEFNNLPNQLVEWQDELNLHKNDKEKCENINSEVKKLEKDVNAKIDQFKRNILLNRTVIFKQKILDKNETNFGQLKCETLKRSGSYYQPNIEENQQDSDSDTPQPPPPTPQPTPQQTTQQTTQASTQSAASNRRKSTVPVESISNLNDSIGKSKAKNLYIAITDHEATSIEEISFEKGDILLIMEVDKKSDTAWIASFHKRNNTNSQHTGKSSGFVNPSHVIKKAYLDNELWFFGSIKRKEAETILKNDSNQTGSFMIRESETNNDSSHCFSLSIRDQSTETKHYRILSSVEQGAFNYFLNPKIKFKSLNELIDYHSKKSEGLCTVLTTPCNK